MTTTRRFVAHSVLYLLPSLLLRGLSFLLTPVYASAMSADDYGVVGIATTLVTLLGIVLGFALYASVGRLYVDCETPESRKAFVGTLLLTLLVAPTLLALSLDGLGALGLLSRFSSLPYTPELRLVIWASLLSTYPSLATAVFTIREDPRRTAVLSVGTAVVQIIATLVLVVHFRMGATGVLWSMFIGNLAGTLGSLLMLIPQASLSFSLPLVRRAFVYSLPLLPHMLSNWAFAVSDRLILERHVSKADIGQYSLAYMFAFAVSMVGSAVISAFGPTAQKTLKALQDTSPELRRISTLVVGAMTFVTLGAALLGPDAIRLATPAGYHGATQYVGLVVLGAFAQAIALVVAQVTWFVERTGFVALITTASAGVNVALNLALVPHWGALASAVTTALSGLALLAMHGAVARRLLPVEWPYRIWALVLGLGLCCAAVDLLLKDASLSLSIGVHLFVVLLVFPAGLLALGVVSKQTVRSFLPFGLKS